ncbi:MAG: ABC transporter ATP-binding protein, partial [Pseudomonadota bacterium]
DEPLSALDAKLRDAMRLELVKLQQSIGVSFVMVTHDQDEAMAVADRIAVLDQGRMVQMASPAELYQRPVDAFVADFIGRVNMFTPTKIEGQRVETEALGTLELPGVPDKAAGDLQLALRPEKIRVSLTAPEAVRGILREGTLGDVAFQGDHSIVEIRLGTGTALTAYADDGQTAALSAVPEGTPIFADWAPEDMMILSKPPHS